MNLNCWPNSRRAYDGARGIETPGFLELRSLCQDRSGLYPTHISLVSQQIPSSLWDEHEPIMLTLCTCPYWIPHKQTKKVCMLARWLTECWYQAHKISCWLLEKQVSDIGGIVLRTNWTPSNIVSLRNGRELMPYILSQWKRRWQISDFKSRPWQTWEQKAGLWADNWLSMPHSLSHPNLTQNCCSWVTPLSNSSPISENSH